MSTDAIPEKVCGDLHLGRRPLTSLTWLRYGEFRSWKGPERCALPGASFEDEITNTQWSGKLPVIAVCPSLPVSDSKM